MPRPKKQIDIFAGIKPREIVRPRKPTTAKIENAIVAQNERTVTIALTMPRDLYEQYNNRGSFRDAMVRQLQKKFDG